MFITTATAMYSLGHRLHTLPAVPRSTQPSTIRGVVKWVSAFGLSNNSKWRWWMWMVAAIYRQTHDPISWLDLRVGGHPALSLYSSDEPGQLSQWPWSWGQHRKRCWIIINYYYYVVVSKNLNAVLTTLTPIIQTSEWCAINLFFFPYSCLW